MAKKTHFGESAFGRLVPTGSVLYLSRGLGGVFPAPSFVRLDILLEDKCTWRRAGINTRTSEGENAEHDAKIMASRNTVSLSAILSVPIGINPTAMRPLSIHLSNFYRTALKFTRCSP